MRSFMTVGAAALMPEFFSPLAQTTSNQPETFPLRERDFRRNWLKIIAN